MKLICVLLLAVLPGLLADRQHVRRSSDTPTPPTWAEPPKTHVSESYQKRVELSCQVQGNPKPEVIWLKERYYIRFNKTLIFESTVGGLLRNERGGGC